MHSCSQNFSALGVGRGGMGGAGGHSAKKELTSRPPLLPSSAAGSVALGLGRHLAHRICHLFPFLRGSCRRPVFLTPEAPGARGSWKLSRLFAPRDFTQRDPRLGPRRGPRPLWKAPSPRPRCGSVQLQAPNRYLL